MRYYLAPMEGVTTWIYRRAHASVYEPLDKYFIPFLEPHEKRDFKKKELDEILPEHNEGMHVVPQILTNRADGFIRLGKALKGLGYEEVNLNLGCPSKTVSVKGKGSGFLAYPEELDHFLEEIFSGLDMKISVKTRIGKEDPEEFERLLEIYNKYEMEELIIHPRVQADFYRNEPRRDVYRMAREKSRNPVCYNGDLFVESYLKNFLEEFPEEDRVMIGRGLIIHPGLVSGQDDKKLFWKFHDLVYQGYLEKDGDQNALYRMKELWFYQIHQFPEADKYAKKLRKVQKRADYEQIIMELLSGRTDQPAHPGGTAFGHSV